MLCEIFKIAYFAAATIENNIGAFGISVIHPFNSSVLPEFDFSVDSRESTTNFTPSEPNTPSVNWSQNYQSTSASTDINQSVPNTAPKGNSSSLTKDSLSIPATYTYTKFIINNWFNP